MQEKYTRHQIMESIGWKRGFPLLAFVFFSLILVIQTLKTIFQVVAEIDPVQIHLMGWVIWFVWLGFLFFPRRRHCIDELGEKAYKSAFWTDILLGVSFGLSQVTYPAYQSFLSTILVTKTFNYEGEAKIVSFLAPFSMVLGLICFGIGIFLLYSAFSHVGVARAGFYYEYAPDPQLHLSTNNIYSYIRHPMFFGAILTSVGLALFFSVEISLKLIVINIAILPIYRLFNDRRLVKIYGNAYNHYRKNVSAFIPKFF